MRVTIGFLVVLTGSIAAVAQPPPQSPSSTSGAECPSGTVESGAKKPSTHAEQSSILPSAGGHGASGAPTVQESGKSIASPLDCTLPSTHPNALPP